MKKFVLGFIASLLIALTLSSCGTTKGIGEDIESVGRGLQRAAQ